MFKRIFLSLIFISSNIFFSSPVFSEERPIIKLKYQVNKTHCLYNFILALSGDLSGSKTLKEIFSKSKYNTKKYNALIDEFQDLRIGEHYYKYNGYPESRNMYKVISNFFVTVSASSKDIDDFSNRITGLLTFSDQQKLLNIIRAFAPVYEDLIWQKSEKDIFDYRDKMKSFSEKSNISDLFKKASVFYNSEWSNDIPFIISFYPIPAKNGHSSATPMGNVETVGVLTGQNDLAGSFSIMFHEMCHSLYDAEASDVQQRIEYYFSNSKSSYANYSYNYLNEALATSIGNGWSFKAVSGKLDKSSWYNDKYINNMAKVIYPNVENYLKNSKTLDQDFVNMYIVKFAETFPNAIYDYDNLFSSMSVYTDNSVSEAKNIKANLRKSFRVAGLSIFSQLKSKDEILATITPDKTVKMYVITDKKLLNDIFSNINFLKKYQENTQTKEDFILSLIEKETTYVFISLNKSSDFSKVVDRLVKDNYINKKFPIIKMQ